MKLSIIIPVYKVELYIENCLNSLLAQDLPVDEYEIIVINDGSPDKSAEIIQSFASRFSNIIFIDQENQGVSVARNRGLDIAKGDFIAFVDPDDSGYENSFKPILERAYGENIDVLYLGFELFDDNGNFIRAVEKNGDDHVILPGFEHPRRTYPATLYKRSVIGNIRFPKGIIRGQDTVFNIMVHATAARCSYCSVPYYKYLQRETSSRQFVGTERNFTSMSLAIETIYAFARSRFRNPKPLEKKYFDDAILLFITRIFEWNILPQRNKSAFDRLKKKLKDLELDYLISAAKKDFPMFDKPFSIFMKYQKFYGLVNVIKSKLRR